MSVPLEQFVRLLSVSGLMTPHDAAVSCASCASAGLTSAEQVSARLVEQGKLTPYQAKRILAGKEKGLVLGEYVVLEEIGTGGMGHVFKAHHRRMDRAVALKVLAPRALASPAALDRFHQEVSAAARLIHPNIVTAFDAGEQDGIHYLVMEYVEGQDLGTVVKENGELPVEDAVNCILQAARGLDYAHSRGIVHRDIKPGNLLLDWAGNVRILDMGVAQIDADLARIEAPPRRAKHRENSETREVLGTLDYMAPEQAMPKHGVDARADIYSLGCTLYRLITGRAPFGGASAAEKIRNHRDGAIPSLQTPRIEVPPSLDVLFHRMIAKRPDDRPRSMGEVIGELETCLLAPRTIVASAATGASGSTYGSASDDAIPPPPAESQDFAYSPAPDHSHESTIVEAETLAHAATDIESAAAESENVADTSRAELPSEFAAVHEPFVSEPIVEPHFDVIAPVSTVELAPPEITPLTPPWPKEHAADPEPVAFATAPLELSADDSPEGAIPLALQEPTVVEPIDSSIQAEVMPPVAEPLVSTPTEISQAAIEPVPVETLALPATTACQRAASPAAEEPVAKANDARPWSMSLILVAIMILGVLATLIGAFLVWYRTQGSEGLPKETSSTVSASSIEVQRHS